MGTELLLGQVVDTNSAWIGEQLALAGIDCFFQSKVGDNPERMRSVISQAVERSDAVIVCGGLGPTHDDITREVIAEVMGVELVLDPEVEARIRRIFEERGRRMPDNNLRQAMVPMGAKVIPKQLGTAPGLICPLGPERPSRAAGESGEPGPERPSRAAGESGEPGSKVIYVVPGVPAEMKAMVSDTIMDDLRSRDGQGAAIRSRVLRIWGTSESGLAEILAPRIHELDALLAAGERACTLAFLASGVEGLKVRLTAKAPTAQEADALLAAEADEVAGLLGDIVFSTDDETMETVVVRLLAELGLTIGTAESVTGGLVAARLTAAPGASKVLLGGIVSYASEVKHSLLGVPEGPVVTAEAAQAMASGACYLLGSDVGVATTGVAGPDTQEGVPVGTVFVGLCLHGDTSSQELKLPGDRDLVQQLATISALDLLRRRLLL